MNSAIRITSAALFTASLVTAPVALAQSNAERDQSGPYVSGSYGGYKSHGGEFEDENDLLGAAVGYQFNPFFALEAEYIDFGNFGEDEVEGKLKGFGLSAVGRLPLT
ncbi:outer membrane beta-barrel protein, partial [Marinobacter sp. UBA2498]